jgi:hypothetical protein
MNLVSYCSRRLFGHFLIRHINIKGEHVCVSALPDTKAAPYCLFLNKCDVKIHKRKKEGDFAFLSVDRTSLAGSIFSSKKILFA